MKVTKITERKFWKHSNGATASPFSLPCGDGWEMISKGFSYRTTEGTTWTPCHIHGGFDTREDAQHYADEKGLWA